MTRTRALPTASWLLQAPCLGDLRFAPAGGDEADTLQAAVELLDVCAACPFRRPCIARVQPQRSDFDGVCGGRVWRNGTVLAECPGTDSSDLHEEGDPYSLCGTVSGAKAHRRRREPSCPACLAIEREKQRSRRERHRLRNGEQPQPKK